MNQVDKSVYLSAHGWTFGASAWATDPISGNIMDIDAAYATQFQREQSKPLSAKPKRAQWVGWRHGSFGTWSIAHLTLDKRQALCGDAIGPQAVRAPKELYRCEKCRAKKKEAMHA